MEFRPHRSVCGEINNKRERNKAIHLREALIKIRAR